MLPVLSHYTVCPPSSRRWCMIEASPAADPHFCFQAICTWGACHHIEHMYHEKLSERCMHPSFLHVLGISFTDMTCAAIESRLSSDMDVRCGVCTCRQVLTSEQVVQGVHNPASASGCTQSPHSRRICRSRPTLRFFGPTWDQLCCS